MSNKNLVDLIRTRSVYYLEKKPRDERVLEAMSRVDRKDFLPELSKNFAYKDSPIPIGFNQTCSQPSMVAFYMDILNIKPGNKILEIGSGCGYASAVASLLCRPGGEVYAVEIVKELAELSRTNLSPYMENIAIFEKDGSVGLKKHSPYDRIFLSAGVNLSRFNENILLEQLNVDGILVYPECYGNLFKITKRKGRLEKETFYGVSFVPLKGENA
ncbi:MAG TPA: protein-L-isoaspartate O-methyltransferase [Spirochaetota bacterium]|jgi:protein-L-isoaspartate(D-aspartate) O-methyltransferase|nr:MAG: Protein-L-isoaspartate O-methyltransferase [Spirochaetes bacterium ADurb.Bin133]HNZ27242.1 protein-L-isoaspartate O-methyltransferase [Spirochaetota bacterium]HPY87107.1 protein-L-isoaspartate O-methyltransferase [Spirochaetota bacterium]HQB60711.1 protein-L-isoaspartate O-methyltransferase [Spirochaetota bacterium]